MRWNPDGIVKQQWNGHRQQALGPMPTIGLWMDVPEYENTFRASDRLRSCTCEISVPRVPCERWAIPSICEGFAEFTRTLTYRRSHQDITKLKKRRKKKESEKERESLERFLSQKGERARAVTYAGAACRFKCAGKFLNFEIQARKTKRQTTGTQLYIADAHFTWKLQQRMQPCGTGYTRVHLRAPRVCSLCGHKPRVPLCRGRSGSSRRALRGCRGGLGYPGTLYGAFVIPTFGGNFNQKDLNTGNHF